MENPKSDQAIKRIVFLDYLRIFAFVTVVIGHKFIFPIQHYIADQSKHPLPRLIANYLSYLVVGGGVGVVVFFLVSGYIITHVLLSEVTIDFLIKRAFRIYPLYCFAIFFELLIAKDSPGVGILIPQLLLIGDFFNVPYALDGVEWTLRIEIMFYLLMAALKIGGFLDQKIKRLPLVFIGFSIFLALTAPFPTSAKLSVSYVSMFMPFLFVGSAFYLKERNEISARLMLLLVTLIFIQYYYLTYTYQPDWLGAHFPDLGVLVFFIAWKYGQHLTATPIVVFLSDLTYSVYLFHKWMWEPIKEVLQPLFVPLLNVDVQTLIVLLICCYLFHISIERPGVRLGKRIAKRI